MYLNAQRGTVVGDTLVWEKGGLWSAWNEIHDRTSTSVLDVSDPADTMASCEYDAYLEYV